MYETVYSTANNKYENYEKESRYRYNRRCIDNSVTGCGNCVGYCQYSEHPGFLTAKLRKQHDCIKKQCFYYVPKPSKQKATKPSADLFPSILNSVRQIMVGEECVKVIRIENTDSKRYTAFYIAITNECEFDKYAAQIKNKWDINVDFVNLNYDFDKCVAMLHMA